MGAPVVHIILKEFHISAKLFLLGWHLGVCSDALSSQFQSATASALPRPVHLQGLDARKTYIFCTSADHKPIPTAKRPYIQIQSG